MCFDIKIDPSRFEIVSYNDWMSQYIFENGCKLVIDSHDSKNVDNTFVNWADVYLKVNMWKNVEYAKNIFPFFGILGYNNIIFRSNLDVEKYRNLDKDIDLLFVNKIWGGREHMVNLFNAVSKIKCKKYLHAILFGENDIKYVNDFDKSITVSKNGIPNLIEKMAKSKLVVVRNAKHLCIPFTMLEALSIGSCVLMDSVPKVKWAVDLKENVNYLSMGLNRPDNTDPCGQDDYNNIKNVVEGYLSNEKLMESIRNNNIEYFDKNLRFESIAKYIMNKVGY